MTHSYMTYKEIAQFIGQAIRQGRLGSLTSDEKRHYKESLENDVFLQMVMQEYHPFAAAWDKWLRASEKLTSQEHTSVADIHDPYFITHKAKGMEFFVQKYGPLNMNDRIERLIDAMRTLGEARQKVCDERLYDSFLEQEERGRQITKARQLAFEKNTEFDESMIEPSAPIEALIEGFGEYVKQSRKELPLQTASIKELAYLETWAQELSRDVAGESANERAERKKELNRRWAVIIEALEESRTSYFLDATPDSYSCAVGLEERLQLKMFYIATAADTGPVAPEKALVEKMIAPFIQKDPDMMSVYYPTDLLYQEYLKAAELSTVDVEERFWQRKEDTSIEYQQIFQQYRQEHMSNYSHIRNPEIVERLMQADFDRVVANAGIGMVMSKKTSFEKLILEKLYELKTHTVSKLRSAKQPTNTAYQVITTPLAQKRILKKLSENLGFTYGFTEMILSIIGQHMILEQEQSTTLLTGLALLNTYVQEERLSIPQDKMIGLNPQWLKEEAQEQYTTYLTKYTDPDSEMSVSIKFLPAEQLGDEFFLLIKNHFLMQAQNHFQANKYQSKLHFDIRLYCELMSEGKLLLKKQEDKYVALQFFANQNSLAGTELVIDMGPGYLHKSEYLGRALAYAAEAGSVEIVQYLLKIPGTNTLFKNKDGLTPFGLAVQSGHQKIVEILKPLAGGGTHQSNFMGDTLLMLALAGRHYDVAEYLLGYHDINVDDHNKLGETALSVAIPDASIEMLKKLFEKQRRYLLAQKQTMTVMYLQGLFFIAANCNRKDFVIFLLETCGDLINQKQRLPGFDGDNILMHLMRKGPEYDDLVRYFMDQPEFDMEYTNSNKDNLLSHAITYANESIVLELIDKKRSEIKPFPLNAQSKSALTLAREKKYTRVASEIEECFQYCRSLMSEQPKTLLFSNQQNFNQIMMTAALHR